MKKKYTEHSLIDKYKNLTSLIEYYKSLDLDDCEKTNILPVVDLEKFVRKAVSTKVYDRNSCCKKLLKLEEELQELVSRKDFDIDYVNDIIQEEEVLVKTIGSAEFIHSYNYFDCIMM